MNFSSENHCQQTVEICHMRSADQPAESDDHITGIVFLYLVCDIQNPLKSRMSSPKWCIFPTARYWALLRLTGSYYAPPMLQRFSVMLRSYTKMYDRHRTFETCLQCRSRPNFPSVSRRVMIGKQKHGHQSSRVGFE